MAVPLVIYCIIHWPSGCSLVLYHNLEAQRLFLMVSTIIVLSTCCSCCSLASSTGQIAVPLVCWLFLSTLPSFTGPMFVLLVLIHHDWPIGCSFVIYYHLLVQWLFPCTLVSYTRPIVVSLVNTIIDWSNDSTFINLYPECSSCSLPSSSDPAKYIYVTETISNLLKYHRLYSVVFIHVCVRFVFIIQLQNYDDHLSEIVIIILTLSTKTWIS